MRKIFTFLLSLFLFLTCISPVLVSAREDYNSDPVDLTPDDYKRLVPIMVKGLGIRFKDSKGRFIKDEKLNNELSKAYLQDVGWSYKGISKHVKKIKTSNGEKFVFDWDGLGKDIKLWRINFSSSMPKLSFADYGSAGNHVFKNVDVNSDGIQFFNSMDKFQLSCFLDYYDVYQKKNFQNSIYMLSDIFFDQSVPWDRRTDTRISNVKVLRFPKQFKKLGNYFYAFDDWHVQKYFGGEKGNFILKKIKYENLTKDVSGSEVIISQTFGFIPVSDLTVPENLSFLNGLSGQNIDSSTQVLCAITTINGQKFFTLIKSEKIGDKYSVITKSDYQNFIQEQNLDMYYMDLKNDLKGIVDVQKRIADVMDKMVDKMGRQWSVMPDEMVKNPQDYLIDRIEKKLNEQGHFIKQSNSILEKILNVLVDFKNSFVDFSKKDIEPASNNFSDKILKVLTDFKNSFNGFLNSDVKPFFSGVLSRLDGIRNNLRLLNIQKIPDLLSSIPKFFKDNFELFGKTLKDIAIPNSEFLGKILSPKISSLRSKMGILDSPFILGEMIFSRLSKLNLDNSVISYPEVRILNTTFINSGSVNLRILDRDPVFANVHVFIRLFCDCFLIFSLFGFISFKLKEWFS